MVEIWKGALSASFVGPTFPIFRVYVGSVVFEIVCGRVWGNMRTDYGRVGALVFVFLEMVGNVAVLADDG